MVPEFRSGFSSECCWSIYGAMIFGYGVFEWTTGSYPPGVQLTNLHTPVWWGGVLALLGLFYVVKFRPGARSRQVATVLDGRGLAQQ